MGSLGFGGIICIPPFGRFGRNMARSPDLSRMDFEALMGLRKQVEDALSTHRATCGTLMKVVRALPQLGP
jgi:hypothetical protein